MPLWYVGTNDVQSSREATPRGVLAAERAYWAWHDAPGDKKPPRFLVIEMRRIYLT